MNNLISSEVKTITQERLKELLSYDKQTGLFIRIKRTAKRVKIGDVAGTNRGSYLAVMLDGKTYSCHRLAWLYEYGIFPSEEIDHINQIKSDNRIINLRIATHSQNQKNLNIRKDNTSGYVGVSWNKKICKWQAYATLNKKLHYLGYFNSAELASEAYQIFAKKNHGEFYSSIYKVEVENV